MNNEKVMNILRQIFTTENGEIVGFSLTIGIIFAGLVLLKIIKI